MKIIVAFMLLIAINPAYSQDLKHKNYILEFLGQEEYDRIQSHNVGYLRFLDVRCSDGWQVIENNDGKFDSYEKIQTLSYTTPDKVEFTISAQDVVSEINSGTFNLIKYNLNWDRSKTMYYVLGNTGKVLVIHPTEYINKIYNSK